MLQADIYVNEADGQLRAAHLILRYTPLSFDFQALKYVIRARDSQLSHISVAYQGFVVPEGVPLPRDTPLTQPLFVATLSAGASASQPVLREKEDRSEEEEEEEERIPEEIVDLTDSSDEFEVFNQTIHSEDDSDEMGVQRKPQRSLMELIENQPGKGATGRSAQSQIPPPPTKSPPPALNQSPHQPQPIKSEAADLKRRREQKGKEVVDTGKPRPTLEEESQRAAKQQKVSHTLQWGQERSDTQPPEPQAWLPAPMHGGEPLRDDASLRDFNSGIGCHVASAVEEALLLLRDMAELKNARKYELFLNNKRYLEMV